MPAHVFILEMVYLIGLIVLLIVYHTDDAFRDALPPLGPLPIQIAWFGATGAVLAGTFDAVAFILGYADDAFRSLIAKLTQLLFAPGKAEPTGPGGG